MRGFPLSTLEELLDSSGLRRRLHWKGFSVTGRERKGTKAPSKPIKRIRIQGAPPGTGNQSGHAKNGLSWRPDKEGEVRFFMGKMPIPSSLGVP